jgi:hypothetical protein
VPTFHTEGPRGTPEARRWRSQLAPTALWHLYGQCAANDTSDGEGPLLDSVQSHTRTRQTRSGVRPEAWDRIWGCGEGAPAGPLCSSPRGRRFLGRSQSFSDSLRFSPICVRWEPQRTRKIPVAVHASCSVRLRHRHTPPRTLCHGRFDRRRFLWNAEGPPGVRPPPKVM